ncbi:hypothetical protein D9619_008820 [Psilocybe cf. subviscida]|uniref:FAD dependent oxidoreductase domain-containing protein n=1 Tax=Psilocybe cf. subviscida TaxID=2480587 RepID=A0A8H5F1D2_9AGAR|nr:hypothetical protein D9619_008820 [Psilocybe cf. subviscida]
MRGGLLTLLSLTLAATTSSSPESGSRLPVANATKSFWIDTPGSNPLAEEGSSGELTRRSDVCIIGSGITGVSVAWHISQAWRHEQQKPSVTIFEAREFCSGATGRNGGHLTRNAFSAFLRREALYGTSESLKSYRLEEYTANSLVDFITARELSDAVGLVEGGHLQIFRTEDDEVAAKKDYDAYQAAREVHFGAREELGVRWIGTEELAKEYGVDANLNYTAVYFIGHNLWPCKLVTELFKDSNNIVLHTKTPVTAITPLVDGLSASHDQTPLTTDETRDRWTLHTPRGTVACKYVVHATNAYASHLLPFLSGSNSNNTNPALPRGAHGIIPTRGQVGTVRAAVSAEELPWLNSWDGGAGGWEYWFPRYQDTLKSQKNPLIVFGGARQHSGGTLETGMVDDSIVNPLVTAALRRFLPTVFPGQFGEVPDEREAEGDPWEMEWTGIMGFTSTGEPLVGPITRPQTPGSIKDSRTYNGQYIAAGFTGHGMPRAYACAEVVAGMITADIWGVEWKKPEWLPERYLNWATHP